MKNFKAFFPIAAIAALLMFSVVACKKGADAESPSIEKTEAADDYSNYDSEELQPETQVDEFYDAEAAATVTFTSAGGQAATSDGDGSCSSAFKYADYYKIGTTPVVLSLVTTGMSSITSITNMNSKTGVSPGAASIVFSSKTNGVDTNHYSVSIAASTADFRQGSAKMSIVYVDGKGVTKTKNVTIKCVGLNASGKIFGTQAWGLMYEGVSSGNLTAAGTTITVSGATSTKDIASNFTPAVGDVLVFSSSIRGVIDSVVMKKDTATIAGIWHSKKYKIYTTQWNVKDCKSSRTKKGQTLEVADFATKLYSKDGTTAATKFVR